VNFTEQDTGSTPGVVLINETMKKKYWPKGDPVGQQLLIGKGVGPQFAEPARQIIGVVGDIRDTGSITIPGRCADFRPAALLDAGKTLFPAPSSSRKVHSSQPTFSRPQGDPGCINPKRTPSRSRS
jgi:hypothetical protein